MPIYLPILVDLILKAFTPAPRILPCPIYCTPALHSTKKPCCLVVYYHIIQSQTWIKTWIENYKAKLSIEQKRREGWGILHADRLTGMNVTHCLRSSHYCHKGEESLFELYAIVWEFASNYCTLTKSLAPGKHWVFNQWRRLRGERLIIMSGTEPMEWHQTPGNHVLNVFNTILQFHSRHYHEPVLTH